MPVDTNFPVADLEGCTVVFDLDGTLVDSAPDLHRALNVVLGEMKLPAVELADVRQSVGHGARRLIERVTAMHGVQLEDAELERLTGRYVEIYASDISALSTIFPGVVETLEWLKRCNAKLCVCTNKRTALSKQLLGALGADHYFEDIIGADAVANRKPHPEHYRAAVAAAGGEVGRSLMVGDTDADAISAREAGAPVALVGFGYTETAPALLGADAVFSHYHELPEITLRLLRVA